MPAVLLNHRTRVGMAAMCLLVAALAGVASVLGILARADTAVTRVTSVRGDTYDMATGGLYAYNAQRVVAEGVGWDVVTLLVAVPALLLAASLVARGSFRGRLLAVGLLGYFLYQYLEYSVTWAFGSLFLLFVAIYGTSLLGILWLGASLIGDDSDPGLAERFPRRGWAILALTMSGLLALMWLARIGQVMGGSTALLEGETTLTVQALDLGLVVPLSVLSGVLVLRRSRSGYLLASAYCVTFAVTTLAITGMLLSAWSVEGTLELVPITIFGLAAAAAVVIAWRAYRGPDVAAAPSATGPEATSTTSRGSAPKSSSVTRSLTVWEVKLPLIWARPPKWSPAGPAPTGRCRQGRWRIAHPGDRRHSRRTAWRRHR